VGVLLFLTPLHLLVSGTVRGQWVADGIKEVVTLLETCCATVSQSKDGVIFIRENWIIVVAFLMILATIVLLGVSLPKKKRWVTYTPIMACWLILAVGLTWGQSQDIQAVNITYLTPSSVSDMVVMTSGDQGIICDFSNGSSSSMHKACRQVEKQGVTEISALVLTHYHGSVVATLSWMTQSQMLRHLWLPEPQDEEERACMLACIEKATLAGVSVHTYSYGEHFMAFPYGMLKIESTLISRSVQPALLMTMTTSAQQMTYCGGGVWESDLADEAQVAVSKSETVIFGHHGPKIKKPYPCTLGEQTDLICFADTKTAAYLPYASYPNECLAVLGPYSFEIKTK